MYFSDLLNSQIYIDMIFSRPLNFSNFNMMAFQNVTVDSAMYKMSMFSVSYVELSSSAYRIIIEPLGYIFLENATFRVETIPQPSPINYSED